MIAWMQNWDTCGLHMQKRRWNGQMTLPRELFLRDGRLYQWPVRELDQIRTDLALKPWERTSAAIGIARNREGDTPDMVFRRADEAMYRNKDAYYSQNGETRRQDGENRQ